MHQKPIEDDAALKLASFLQTNMVDLEDAKFLVFCVDDKGFECDPAGFDTIDHCRDFVSIMLSDWGFALAYRLDRGTGNVTAMAPKLNS